MSKRSEVLGSVFRDGAAVEVKVRTCPRDRIRKEASAEGVQGMGFRAGAVGKNIETGGI